MISIRILLFISNLLIYFSIVSSCKSKDDKYSFVPIDISEILKSSNDTASSRPFSKIVNQIASYPTVDGGAVGIAGRQSEQYRRFLWLEQNATEEELIQLTENSNVNVKVYAFMALCNRNSQACKQVFKKHIADTDQFNQFAGCMQMPKYVNVFYLNYLSAKLSPAEIAGYKMEVSKHFSAESWEFIERMNMF